MSIFRVKSLIATVQVLTFFVFAPAALAQLEAIQNASVSCRDHTTFAMGQFDFSKHDNKISIKIQAISSEIGSLGNQLGVLSSTSIYQYDVLELKAEAAQMSWQKTPCAYATRDPRLMGCTLIITEGKFSSSRETVTPEVFSSGISAYVNNSLDTSVYASPELNQAVKDRRLSFRFQITNNADTPQQKSAELNLSFQPNECTGTFKK